LSLLHKKIIWSAQTNASTINKTILTRMKEAGCVQVSFGVESGNDELTLLLNKKASCP